MSKRPLSPKQREALKRLADGQRRSAYALSASLGTLGSLEKRGLVTAKRGLGSMFCPASNIEWRITNDGLRVLNPPPVRDPTRCSICKCVLDTEEDPVGSRDCGGDCLRCMAEAGDPGCLASAVVERLNKHDGTPFVAPEEEDAPHVVTERKAPEHGWVRRSDIGPDVWELPDGSFYEARPGETPKLVTCAARAPLTDKEEGT